MEELYKDLGVLYCKLVAVTYVACPELAIALKLR